MPPPRPAASAFSTRPVSGGQAGAENGKLTIMVGGDAAGFARAEARSPTMRAPVTLMGGPGSGQLTKMVNQICIAGLVQALAEGVDFATRAGLDVERVLDVIGKGAAQSWQMDNRGRTMAADKYDFGFAVDWMRKDLGICLAEARANGAALPVTALVDQFYARVRPARRRALGQLEPDPGVSDAVDASADRHNTSPAAGCGGCAGEAGAQRAPASPSMIVTS